MKNGLLKLCSGLGAVLGIVSAIMWVFAAQAQKFSIDPTQAAVANIWNAQSAEFNYHAAMLTAAAAALVGIAVFLKD